MYIVFYLNFHNNSLTKSIQKLLEVAFYECLSLSMVQLKCLMVSSS